MARTAAIVTVGSELVTGLRIDTNTAHIARTLTPYGFDVIEAVSVGDDVDALSRVLARLTSQYELVITTGGLGPTHDDITRDAAAQALGVDLVRDPRLVELLREVQARHTQQQARDQIFTQADVLAGARVIDAVTGTAPGQIASTPAGTLAILPGPPSEMQPMLPAVLEPFSSARAETRELGVVGMSESDAQAIVDAVLDGREDVGFTVLAKPGDVRVILTDRGAGSSALDGLARTIARDLGPGCYADDGATLAQTLVHLATAAGVRLCTAESCTGGLVAAALTDVPGSSAAFVGGVVSYANEAKTELLDVSAGLLAQYGAVSEQTAVAMAQGALDAFADADLAVAVTGVAGPDGGTADKPVGTVWFAVASREPRLVIGDDGSGDPRGIHAFLRTMRGSGREAIRARSTSLALDALRRAVLGIAQPG